MHPTLYLFYVFATILVIAAVGVISIRNPVHSVMLLVLCFASSAVLWVLLQAEFLGIILILVYVGAVMVLFLFVVMMLDVGADSLKGAFARYLPLGMLIGAIAVVEIVVVVTGASFSGARYNAPAPSVDYSNIQALGSQIYTVYAYPFELASVILLLAIVSAIALTLRRRGRRRYQNPGAQSRVRATDRLRLVKMESEKQPGGE